MATYKVCDLCANELMESFNDSAYKITVKKLQHRYDGFAPWVSKQKIEICEDCGFAIQEVAKQLAQNPKEAKE